MEITTIASYKELPRGIVMDRFLAMSAEEAAAEYRNRFGVLPERGYRVVSSANRAVYCFVLPKGAEVPEIHPNLTLDNP